MDSKSDLEETLERLDKLLDRAARFLPPDIRAEMGSIGSALKQGAGQLQARCDAAELGADFDPFWGDTEVEPRAAAEALCDWARQEDGRKVEAALRAIRGGACCRPPPDFLRVAGQC